ncbi:hypothetical protein E6Q11_03995 [Candidatus Dojkabacteria bacterium]|uniref:Peptidase S74 domain-containing protein n=1 Tax=Candidatus Dojkabacteria bacterium TaxID=2099670 RepID=A0A5C7J5M3_9BACT|nr:MAG: hypothetical protein E6Q11_03995 [Candidatus Dojkabacteria bacterium]
MSILTQEQQRFLDVAALRAITHTPQFNERVYIQSVANPSYIKEYAWESSSTLSDDGVNVIKVTAIATGRFHLVNVDAKFINKSTTAPSGINDGDTYFQDEVVTGTTQTSPNRFWGKVGGAWVELFQSWWKLVGTVLKLNSGAPLIRDAIQVQTASGVSQGFVGVRRSPDTTGQFEISTDGDFAMKGIQLYETFQGAGAENSEARNLLNHYIQISNTNRFVRIATNMSFPAYGYLTLSLNAVSANSSIQFTHEFQIGVGLGGDFQASYTGTQTGSYNKRPPILYYAVEGGKLIIYVEFLATDLTAFTLTAYTQAHFRTLYNTTKAELSGWSVIGQSANGASVTAIPVSNSVNDLYAFGTIYSATGQTTLAPIPSMAKFKELLPEISDKTALELAALLPRRLFKYIESGLRAYGWIVEEVQNAFETVRIDASEAEQALLDDLLNDTVLMFDERKAFPEDWQPFEPKQADEQGEMTDEEYKEYLDKFQKEQDAALSDFTKRLEELPTEKLYTVNPDAIAYIKDRAFHIVLSKF